MTRGSAVPLVERILSPVHQFARVSSSGGIVLMLAAVVALVWANSAWAASYWHLLDTPIGIGIGGWGLQITLHHLINDGLMAVFFFLVGLEIKREVLAGELSTVRTALLPMIAALGGMVVPAALYAILNHGGPGVAGWGIPMATDIAFALGVLALLGDRVPVGLKVFLAALAIVDDIGAVLVIAVFYSTGIIWAALGWSAVLLLLAALANVAGVRRSWPYALIGVLLLMTITASGVHATVAGVLLALTIPVRTRIDEASFLADAARTLRDFDAASQETAANPAKTVLSNTDHHDALEALETLADQAQPPLIRMEHSLHGIVAFFIIPLFALANAGVSIAPEQLRSAAASPISIGAALGLLIGKPLGIFAFSWLAVRSGIAALPQGVSWEMVRGAGVLGGIGFTMALFIAALAFAGSPLLDVAKIGIFGASTVAGVLGWMLVRRSVAQPVALERSAAAMALDATAGSRDLQE